MGCSARVQSLRLALGEESLLARIARGDRSAVQDCLDRYGPLVSSLCRRMLADAAEVDDVVQEVFIELWKSAPRYDAGLCSEPAFVAMVARRRSIDARRRRGRRGATGELTSDLSNERLDELARAATRETADPLTLAEARDEARAARGAFDQLRPEQQRVLRLSIYAGLSHQEIAASTGMPLGTVKTHARRGLERVRDLLQRGASATGAGRPAPTPREVGA